MRLTVVSVHGLGWGDLDDGPLLDAMVGRFDVLVTLDRSLRYQQNLATRPMTVNLVRCRSNRMADLLPLVPAIEQAIAHGTPGTVSVVS
ncbi:MAG: hypothetical protein MUF00_17875 [Gemmatimonadaceae bacterium]|nr:hypothetical protein [Gemmatimonadaceae bacterium]